MATPCMNPEPHGPHPWAIAANPGEPGPDYFQCDGRQTRAPVAPSMILGSKVGIPIGVDTRAWPRGRAHAYTETTHYPPWAAAHPRDECAGLGCASPQTEPPNGAIHFEGQPPTSQQREAVTRLAESLELPESVVDDLDDYVSRCDCAHCVPRSPDDDDD